MSDFVVGDKTYRAGKIPAMVQLNVARRLAPIVAALVASKKPDDDVVTITDLAGPMADAFSKMADQDVEYVMAKCLSVVSVRRDGDTGWVRIWNDAANAPQFEDIDLVTMVTIVSEVVKQQLGPFGSGLGSLSQR